MPSWVKGDVLDVQMMVMRSLNLQPGHTAKTAGARVSRLTTKKKENSLIYSQPWSGSLNIPSQLKALSLPVFEGRQHSGIDVSNILSVHCSVYRS